jgi:hypothetical protein
METPESLERKSRWKYSRPEREREEKRGKRDKQRSAAFRKSINRIEKNIRNSLQKAIRIVGCT